MAVIGAGGRLPRRLVVGWAGLGGLSGTAGAHGPHGTGGEPVAFAVVLGLPIVAGLGGGVIAIRRLRAERPTGHRDGVVLGVALALLGATFAASALSTSRSLAIVGGCVGAISGLWLTRGGRAPIDGCHADLALGAVTAHRLVEGLAVAALYSAGAAVGLLGAVLLAGHAAVETAAVGGTYATETVLPRAVAAVLVVQVGFLGGAITGLRVADALPASIRATAVAIAGGVLVIVGVNRAVRSLAKERLGPGIANGSWR